MRRLLAAVVSLAGLGVAVIPALAADGAVSASGFAFVPDTVQIQPGERVTWANDGGTHNVRFVDGQFEEPPAPSGTWTEEVARTFPDTGEYRYYCEQHGSPAGGMSGTVIVGDPPPSPTPTPTPSPTPTPGATPTPPPAGGDPPSVGVERTQARYCVGRRKRCRRPGFVLAVDASQAVALRAALRRDGAAIGAIAWTAEAGTSTARFRRVRGRRLKPGRYRLAIAAPDHPVLEFDPIRFRVVRR